MMLTEKRIRDAKPSPRTRIEWDETAHGLGLRITTAGAKSFVLGYYVDGVRRRMTLGRAGDLTLEGARQRARTHRQAARESADPLQEVRNRRDLPQVSEALDRFQLEYMARRMELGRMANSTAKEYRHGDRTGAAAGSGSSATRGACSIGCRSSSPRRRILWSS